jgi:thiol-disulfide isomerase/thioredoxin
VRPIIWALLVLVSASCLAVSADQSLKRKTATDFSNVKLSDTTEDAAYAAPGESLARTAGGLLLGKPAPVAQMKSIDGRMIDLGQDYGIRPVYIKFWATWCMPCRQQMPAFEKLYEQMGGKIRFIALNIGLSDDLNSIRTMQMIYGLKMPIVMDDGRFAQLFNLRVTPQHVLIGRDARFAYFGHADNKELAQAVQRVLAQPPSAKPAVSAAPSERPYKVGEVVRGLTASTTVGTRVPLAAAGPGRLRGVMFFSSWCEWYLEKRRPGTSKACVRARQAAERMAMKDKGIDWIGISGGPWSTAQDLADYQKNKKVMMPLSLDESGALFRAFGIRDIPTIALIDSGGRIVRIINPNDTNIEAAVLAAKSGALR